MKTHPRPTRSSSARVFTALLASFMILVTPVMPVASASSPRAGRRADGYTPAGAFNPAATVVKATKTDSFADPDGDGKAEPGDTITYDVNVSNTGAADATGVSFTDNIDPNTTLVPGSLRVSPLAFADSYSTSKDAALSVPAPGVLANDTGTPAPSAQPIAGGPTSQGGTVTLNADGSFNYTPPAGFEGADTFTYTAANGLAPNDTATVTINIDAGPTVASTSPANGATNVAQNSNITVNFSEPVNATNASFSLQCPTGSPQSFTLLNASPSSSFTLDPTADLPAGTTCTVTVSGNQITDADNFDPPDQMAADYTFSFGVKPLAVDDMHSVTGNVRINTTASGYSVLANDQAPGATITSFDASSAHGGSVVMNTSTGTFTYDPPRGFTGTDSFNYTIGNAAGSDQGTVVLTVTDMIWFVNNAVGACSSGCDGRLTHPFTSLADFQSVNGNGTTAGGVVVDPEAGDNVFIYTGSGSYAGPVTLENGQRVIGQGASGALVGVGSLTGISLAPDSDALPSTGGTAPSITSGGNGFNLAANDQLYGLAFSNTTGTAINDGSNVGALVIGDVSINNTGTTGAGISLSSGGTFTTTGVNSIATGAATALNVSNTSIGAAGITFRSISSNGAPSGIVLNNTGTAGGLTVTGNSSGICGGSVTNTTTPGTAATVTAPSTADCTGGTIQSSTGNGISLTNVGPVSLTRVRVLNSGTTGIKVSGATGFTLDHSNVTDSAGGATDEGVSLANVSGGVTISNDIVDSAPHNQIVVDNNNVNVSSFTISGSTIKCTSGNACQPSGPAGNDGLLLQMRGTSVLTSGSITGSAFTGLRATGAQIITSNTARIGQSSGGVITSPAASNSFTVQNCTFTSNNIALDISQGETSSEAFRVLSNTMQNQDSHAINSATTAGPGTGPASHFQVGTIDGNVIGIAGVKDSGSAFGDGIRVVTQGDNTQGSVTISNNTIREVVNADIINLIGQDGAGVTGTGTARFNVVNNSMPQPSGSSLDLCGIPNTPCATVGIDVTADEGYPVCVNISGNSVYDLATMNGYADVYLAQRGGTLTVQGSGDPATQIINTNTLAGDSKVIDESGNTSTGTCGAFPTVAAVQGLTGGAAADTVVSASAYLDQFSASDAVKVASLGDAAKYAFANRTKAARPLASGATSTQAVSGPAQKSAKLADTGTARKADASVKTSAAPSALTATALSGETVSASVGTLPAGKTVHISFQVTVNNPFPGGTSQVANQGSVSGDNFASVLTDDPAAGGSADATVTPILTAPDVTVKDASVNEPASGSNSAAFAVTLSHSYTHPVSISFATADDTGGANPATAGSDYTPTSGTLTFNPGDVVKTVSVPVLADGDSTETNETFLVQISGATGGATITRAQATGTITPESTPGTVVISELRTSGPAGAGDDFVELLNNTGSDITVQATDSSAGWALVKSGNDCTSTPVVVAVIPNGAVIPAHGNYLIVGSQYSLAAYATGDQTLGSDIDADHNVALFNTADLSNLSTGTRLDAVGFGSNAGGNCDLLREGATLQPASGSASEYSFVRKVDKGSTQDTNDNSADFVVVSTTPATPVGSNATPTLGAPGPENSTGPRGPVACSDPGAAKFGRSLLDSTVGAASAPNIAHDATSDPANNSTFGTIDFRRRFTNNTGGAVTALRFRITNTTNPATPGKADLRARSSSAVVVSGVNDAATCGGPAPCSVVVQGTTLEQPPAQASGGGVNSSLGVSTITFATPLAPGASVDLHLLFGVQQQGDYHVSIVVEAATNGQIGQDEWELRGNTQTGGDTEGGCNTPPVANAGPDQTIECGGATSPVTLDGTASSDADGDTLTYEWREGATVLGATAVVNTSLAFGAHTITLKVTDPSGDFSEDTVGVNIVDTTDPMITAPPNVSVNTGPGATTCGAFVSDATLGAPSASDGCSSSVTVTRAGVPSGNVFPVGTTIVTYTADDGHGHTAKAYQSVTVNDNTPPTISAPANITVNAPANSCTANVNPGTATAGDNCPGTTVAGARSDSQPLNAPYPVGTTTITWTATDAHGNHATATQTVTVKDVTPPVITLTSGVINLAPPNHQYVTFSISDLVASASDGCDASVNINKVVISKVTSDEAEDAAGNGDGNTLNDIVIAPDCKSLQLRSERDGGGDGRVYTITLQVKDSSGNVATAVRKVFVPKTGPAVDSGPHYTVNGCNP